MIINLALFIIYGVAAYLCFMIMGQLTSAGSASAGSAVRALFYPHTFALMCLSYCLWVLSVYYGLRITSMTIAVLTAMGVMVSFAFAVVFLGAEFTSARSAGLLLVLAGIYLLA